MITTKRVSATTSLAALSLTGLLVTGCSSGSADSDSASRAGATAADATVVDSATPRLAVSYDGGILVLDADTLDVVGQEDAEGFVRINPAGDGRHVFVSGADGFTALDTGTWTDGGTHYTADPSLTGITFGATTPGHVVRHDGRTVLFDDGTGRVLVLDPAELASGDAAVTREYTTPEAHHGVAVELSDGTLITTEGNEDERHSVVARGPGDEEIARTDDCPGVHGEAVADGETVIVGCENGLVLYRDGAFRKVSSLDPYGRIGNQAGDEESAFVLGDYKVDPDAELERPERVSITNVRSGELTLVDLPASHTFRSLARGPHGEALVLGTDGALHVIDPETARVTRSIEVVDPWTEPGKWQSPRPALFVADHTAYVTDPATDSLHAVDIESGAVTASATLPETPNEITGVTG
ncbi:hypothetical protein DW322_06510 [Rhodococcus rhodnii]|nr:zinc metallochaperone AztD [Rhodococcus rhodnii]TXG89927.1 hypothetical protein DW322_06510 [Rhodococcus rhodnii]